MRTKLTFYFLIFLYSVTTTAQSNEEVLPVSRTHSIQTNLLSFVRYQNAVNLQYRYQNLKDRRGLIASIDLPFYLKKEPEDQIYRFKSSVVFPTFDLKLMFTKNFGTVSEAYVGIGFDYGFNQYRHQHTVCLSSDLINGTCICNRYESNTFSSARHRAGMTLRFAVPIRFSAKFTAFIAFQTSFSYIMQPRLKDRIYQNQCGLQENDNPPKSEIEILTYNASNPDFRGAQGQFHIEFILPIKTFHR